MLHSFLFEIKDHRRAQGKRYQQGHILLFAIFAILSGASSYRKVERFILRHYVTLDHHFDLPWKRCPAYTTIRDIIQGTSAVELEACFRRYSAQLVDPATPTGRWVACDGKVLRGSFDHFHDQAAVQIFSVFATQERIILAHEEIAAKTNEIPTAQALMENLGLTDCIFTLDALHCQKNIVDRQKNG